MMKQYLNEALLSTRAEEWMTTSPLCLKKNDPINHAFKLMEENTIHHLPVIGEKGNAEGIVSHKDLALLLDWKTTLEIGAFREQNEKIVKSLLVGDIMTKNPVTVEVDDTLEDCLKKFMANTFHALLVEKDNQLVGIITTYDLLFRLYNPQGD